MPIHYYILMQFTERILDDIFLNMWNTKLTAGTTTVVLTLLFNDAFNC
jgi:hypothetical protein